MFGQILTGDFNGDGREDYLRLGGTYSHEFLTNSPFPDRLTSITPAYGPTTTLTYKPLTDATVYTKDSTAVSPFTVTDYQGAMYVVSKVETSNAVGGNFTTDYTYGGAKIDHDGRGFLGFRWVQSKDGSGLYTKTYYSQTFPTTGIPTSVEQWRPGSGSDRMVKSVTNTLAYKKTLGSANTYFPYVSSSVETTYDLATGWWGEVYGMRTTTAMGYDEYGNPGPVGNPITVSTSDGYTKTTTNTYNNDTANWLLDQLTRTQVTNTGPGLLSLTRTSGFTYFPTTGFLQQEQIEPDKAEFRVTTDYTYDSYGRRITAAVSGTGSCTAATVGACVNTGIVARTTKTTYDINGRLNGNASTLLVWANKVTNALDQSETQEFDPRSGAMTKLTGPNGSTMATRWEYDPFGRKSKEIRADGTNTSWTFADADANKPANAVRMISTTSTGEPNAAVYLDSLSREVRKRVQGFNGTEVFVDTEYDANGRVYRVSRPYYVGQGAYWSYPLYDILGRVTQQTAANGGITKTVYSYNTVTVTDHNLHSTTQTRNGLGQLVLVTDAKSGTVNYKYDAFGNLLTTTDPVGNVVTMEYNQRGQKTRLIDKDMGTWNYIYDVLGQLLTQTDAKNQVSTMTYDVLGRMTQRVENGMTSSMTSIWAYDTAANGKGKLASASTNTGYSRVYTYDTIGRAYRETTTTDGVAYTIETGFDTSGRVSTLTYPSSFSVTNNYNTYGYQSSVTKTGTPTTAYWTANFQNAAGQVTEELLGNFVKTKRTIDPATGWVDAIYGGITTGTEVQNSLFVFDKVGNLTRRTNENAGIYEDFGYDQLNRLTSTSGGPVNNNTSKTYAYDSIGNITSKSDVGTYAYANGRPHAVSSTTGTINASYLYDANGNMTSGNGVTIAYTAWNMPSTITKGTLTTTFGYDSEHQRTIETVGTSKKSIFINPRIDAGIHYEVETTNGVVENKHYIYARGAPVALYTNRPTGTSDTVYFHKDHLGSIVGITKSDASVAAQYYFDAWGKRVVLSGTTDYTHHGYTGHQQLDDYGLIHMNGRIYDPVLGRFQTADPNVFYPETTQGFNRYSYVDNNPLSYTDPSGFSWVSDKWDTFAGWYNSGNNAKDFWRGVGIVVTVVAVVAICAGSSGVACGPAIIAAKGFWGGVLVAGVATTAMGQPIIPINIPYGGGSSSSSSSGSSGGSVSSSSVAGGGVSDAMADAGQVLRAVYERERAWFEQSMVEFRSNETIQARLYADGMLSMGAVPPVLAAAEALALNSAARAAANTAARAAARGLSTPKVGNPKLNNLVDDLYKGAKGPNPLGTGSTADAIRNEIATGLPTFGRFHSGKGEQYINALNSWIRKNPDASYYDRVVAESLKRDLQNALGRD